MAEWTIAKAFIELGVKGEAAVQGKLNEQKLAVDRQLPSLSGGAGRSFVAQTLAVKAAQERFQKALAHEGNVQKYGKFGAGAVELGGALKGGLSAIGGPVGVAVTAINAGVELVGKFWGMLKGAFDTAMNFARAANPVAAERMDYAIRDMTAVIGRLFVPLMEKATEVIRIFADFLSTVLPSASEMRAVFSQLEPAIREMKIALQDFAPVFRLILVDTLREAATAMKFFGDAIQGVLFVIRSLPGFSEFGKGSGAPLKSSFGAGDFRTPSFVGIAEAKNAFMIEALRASVSQGGSDPAAETAGHTKTLTDQAATLITMLGNFTTAGSLLNTAANLAKAFGS